MLKTKIKKKYIEIKKLIDHNHDSNCSALSLNILYIVLVGCAAIFFFFWSYPLLIFSSVEKSLIHFYNLVVTITQTQKKNGKKRKKKKQQTELERGRCMADILA